MFGSDAFAGNLVQVNDTIRYLHCSLFGEVLTRIICGQRLEQADQVQRRSIVSRCFFYHNLVGDQLKFMVEDYMSGIRLGSCGL